MATLSSLPLSCHTRISTIPPNRRATANYTALFAEEVEPRRTNRFRDAIPAAQYEV